MRNWSKERIIIELRKLKREGVSMNAKSVKIADRPLYDACLRYFDGRFKNAVLYAGVEPQCIYDHWTDDRIKEELEEWVRHFGPLHSETIYKANKPLAKAVERRFGSIKNAAGLFKMPLITGRINTSSVGLD